MLNMFLTWLNKCRITNFVTNQKLVFKKGLKKSSLLNQVHSLTPARTLPISGLKSELKLIKPPDTDHWIQKSIKWIFNSGLFWAVRAVEKKSKLP